MTEGCPGRGSRPAVRSQQVDGHPRETAGGTWRAQSAGDAFTDAREHRGNFRFHPDVFRTGSRATECRPFVRRPARHCTRLSGGIGELRVAPRHTSGMCGGHVEGRRAREAFRRSSLPPGKDVGGTTIAGYGWPTGASRNSWSVPRSRRRSRKRKRRRPRHTFRMPAS
jgi:hypothetical protein